MHTQRYLNTHSHMHNTCMCMHMHTHTRAHTHTEREREIERENNNKSKKKDNLDVIYICFSYLIGLVFCFFLIVFISSVCMIILPEGMPLKHVCRVSAQTRRGRSESLELELQIVVSCRVSVENQILWSRSQRSGPPSHLSTPDSFVLKVRKEHGDKT